MGKRSSFPRHDKDFYRTPKEAVKPLLPFVVGFTYIEPCAGDGSLIEHLPLPLYSASDIDPKAPGIIQKDALTFTREDAGHADMFITNPPWSRDLLHPLIEHLSSIRPTWLLFDADWPHTVQSRPLMRRCHRIVSVGRVKWFPDSPHTGKDNCCWYLFDFERTTTMFYGR